MTEPNLPFKAGGWDFTNQQWIVPQQGEKGFIIKLKAKIKSGVGTWNKFPWASSGSSINGVVPNKSSTSKSIANAYIANNCNAAFAVAQADTNNHGSLSLLIRGIKFQHTQGTTMTPVSGGERLKPGAIKSKAI